MPMLTWKIQAHGRQVHDPPETLEFTETFYLQGHWFLILRNSHMEEMHSAWCGAGLKVPTSNLVVDSPGNQPWPLPSLVYLSTFQKSPH